MNLKYLKPYSILKNKGIRIPGNLAEKLFYELLEQRTESNKVWLYPAKTGFFVLEDPESELFDLSMEFRELRDSGIYDEDLACLEDYDLDKLECVESETEDQLLKQELLHELSASLPSPPMMLSASEFPKLILEYPIKWFGLDEIDNLEKDENYRQILSSITLVVGLYKRQVTTKVIDKNTEDGRCARRGKILEITLNLSDDNFNDAQKDGLSASIMRLIHVTVKEIFSIKLPYPKTRMED